MFATALTAAAVAVGLALFAVASVFDHGMMKRGHGRSATAASAPRCRGDQLRLSAPKTWDVAAGSLLEPFTLTNVSHATCSVAGWPTVRLVDAGGRAMRTRTFRYTYSNRVKVPFWVVTVHPGRAASFNYFASDWNPIANRACPNARRVRVRLPAQRRWFSVVLKIPACGTLYVDPLIAGRTDGRWGGVGIQHFAHP